MKWPFTKDRRSEQGRREAEDRRDESRDDSEKSDRRASDRRGDERRENVRLYYPPTDMLNITDSDPGYISEKFSVLDMISEKAIRLICVADCAGCEMPVGLNDRIKTTIEFHDGTNLKTAGKVLRYMGDTKMKKNVMIYLLDLAVPMSVISSEQRYLLQNYPDFLAAMRSN